MKKVWMLNCVFNHGGDYEKSYTIVTETILMVIPKAEFYGSGGGEELGDVAYTLPYKDSEIPILEKILRKRLNNLEGQFGIKTKTALEKVNKYEI